MKPPRRVVGYRREVPSSWEYLPLPSSSMGVSQSLAELAASRALARADAHAAYSPTKPSSAEARAVLSLSAVEQAAALAANRVTSEALVLASIERVHSVGWTLNAVTHELFESALRDAKASDARRAAGARLGPMDGIPISIKDVFDIEGADTTQGLAVRCFKNASADGLIAALLRARGAILICKSNVPQCLMVPETDNAIFGRCLNPWAADRTPGGSSGGEGALISARCTAMGLGSDIGGSIRIPALFTGICGFKPTADRCTQHGMPAPRPGGFDGQNGVLAVAGPLARTCADLELFLSELLREGESSQWAGASGIPGDASVPPLAWSSAAVAACKGKKLRVGVLLADGFLVRCARLRARGERRGFCLGARGS